MKYNILIKYINGFPSVNDGEQISLDRLSLICNLLGRVNIGNGYIHIGGGAYAHASAMALESILCEAGYSVCRISDAHSFDVRQSVYINRETPSIEDYTEVLTDIRSIVKKHSDVQFLREEIVFAFALYMSKLMGCKYVILECTTEVGSLLSTICNKYNYAIVSKIYENISEEALDSRCKAIDRVTRGVVTGNNGFYRYFSDKCQRFGIRLSIHRSFEIVSESNRSRVINYGGKEYKIKSSSDMLCDAVISTIELVEIMKSHGAKITPKEMVDGIASMSTAGFFEIMSSSPLIVGDVSAKEGEIALVLSRLSLTLDKGGDKKLFVCAENDELYGMVRACSGDIEISRIDVSCEETSEQKKYSRIAKGIIEAGKSSSVLLLGSCEFVLGVKSAFVLMMNKL